MIRRAMALAMLLSIATVSVAVAQPDPIDSSTIAVIDPEIQAEIDRQAREEGFGNDAEMPDLVGALIQMVLVLGVVCALAYLILGKVLPKLMRVQMPTAPHQMLEIVDRMPLDQRRSIMVIKLGDRYFLVGATENGINLLSRLETDEIEDALANAAERRDAHSLGRFAGNLLQRARKES